MQDDQDQDAGIISARPERGGAAQGPGSDLGLYAAPAEAFPAIAIGMAATMLPVTAAAHPTPFSGAAEPAQAAALSPAPADAAASSAAVTSFSPAAGEPGSATPADDRGPASGGAIAADAATPVPAGFATGEWFPGRLEAPAIAASPAAGDAAGGTNPAQAATVATDLTAPVLAQTATDLADPLLVQATLATGLIDATTQTLLTQALAGVTALDLVRDGVLPTLGETVDTTLDQVGLIGQDLAAGLDDTLTGTVGALDAVTQTIAQPVAPLLTPALDSVQQAGAALGQTATRTVTQTLETVIEVVAPVAGTVGDVADPLVGTVDGLVGSVIPAAVGGNVVGDTVATVVPGVTDTLAGLTGADPAGGIGTLTSLVSAADMFAVNDDGPAETGLGNVLGVGGLLDTLAPPLADTILLGGHDLSHDGLHDLDDLHLGLG